MKVSTLATFATLFAGIVPAMGDGSYSFNESGVVFTVDYYEDGRAKPYEASFTYNDTYNEYTFGETGLIKIIESGGDETYQVKYADGYIKKIIDISRRRQLTEDTEHEEDGGAMAKEERHRRLSTCAACLTSWEVLCAVGSNSVYDIIAPENPIAARGVLSNEAEAGVFAFQEYFKDGCETRAAYTLCDGCDCVPALQFSLEPQDEGDIDLVVTEPSGTVVRYNNTDGDFGFLDNDNTNGNGSDPENYFVTDGLTGTDMLGTYSAKVTRYDAPGDFFFKLKASVGGIKVWKKKATLEDGDDESKTWTVTLDSYIDNECTSQVFNIIDEDDAPTKPPV